MADNCVLLKQLISKLTGFPESSYETKKNFKQCQAFLRQYHPLEINPKSVYRELEQLCEKLEIHSLEFKKIALTNMYKKLIQYCDYSLDLDNYLMMHGIILFLLEINGSMVNSYEFHEIVEKDDILINQNIDWGEILTKSEDILSLTRQDYSEISSDNDSDYFNDTCDEVHDTKVKIINDVLPYNDNYNLIKSDIWNKTDINNECLSSLQSEYWFDCYNTKYLSKLLIKNNNNLSLFIDNWEKYFQETQSDCYYNEYRKRIELSEYQMLREIIDVLLGSNQSYIFHIEHDSKLITKNRFKVSKSIKLINLTWHMVDNILEQFTDIATNCYNLRIVCSYIIRNNSIIEIPPSIVALGERLHFYLNEFSDVIVKLEAQSRGNIGLSLFELLNAVDLWKNRIRFLNEIVVCVTSDRFDALNCNITVITLLNLLYKMMNESCLVITDMWINKCILDLFYQTFKPYLYSLDALLSGQVHISSQNVFLTNNIEKFDRGNIINYWNNNFTLRKPNSDFILNDIPNLLQPFIVYLISTIKAIDLLRILSIELTKPSLLNSIIIEPGRFLENFNPNKRLLNSDHISIIPLYTFELRNDFNVPQRHVVLHHISNKLINDLCTNIKKPIIDEPKMLTESNNDVMESCRHLHDNLQSNIVDRYNFVNAHLINVFIDDLGLKNTLDVINSVYFFQAGVEAYDLCSFVFDMVANHSYDIPDLALNINLKLQQVFSESNNTTLRSEAHRLSISLLPSDSHDNDDVSTYNQMTLPHIVIGYDIPWYLRVVITDNILHIANKCYQFILRLKFAKHCLERKIHSERSGNHRWPLLFNRMCALRLNLLQIINNFHVYIMNTFIIPSWLTLNKKLMEPQNEIDDFTDFIHQITEPFHTMMRGCLQSNEMQTIEKAIRKIVFLGIETAQLDVGSNKILMKNLDEKYKRLISFISAMIGSLANLGISIGELDMSIFK